MDQYITGANIIAAQAVPRRRRPEKRAGNVARRALAIPLIKRIVIIMSRASYHAHKAQGMCTLCGIRPASTGSYRCEPCIFTARRQNHIWRHHPEQMPRLVRLLGIYTAPTLPLLAHCGAWHEIAHVPFTAPCCGTKLFEEC